MDIELKFNLVLNEIIEASTIEINRSKHSNETGTIKDRRLGEINNTLCETCGLTKNNGCNGHQGKIPLGNKILIYPSLIQEIKNILNFFCYGCKLLKNKSKIKESLVSSASLKCNNSFCLENYGNFKYKDNRFYVKKGKIDIECDNKVLYEILKMGKNDLKELFSIYDIENAFMVKYMIAPSNVIRQPSVFDLNETNKLSNKYNKIISELSKREVDIQQSLNDLDNDKSIKPYNKDNVKSITLNDLASEYNKRSLLRNNILSIRGENNGRSVVSQGIDLNIGDVGLPMKIANNLSDSVYYSRFSKERVKNAIYSNEVMYLVKKKKVNYCDKYQVFSYVKKKSKDFEKMSMVLEYGDFIEILKPEGSYILRVRQPTLYKWNITSDRVIFNKNGEDTLRTNTSSITARGEDYDGDEESLYNPQSRCSQLESSITMSSRAIIKNNSLGVLAYGLIQDQIIALHLLSKMEIIDLSNTVLILGKYCCLINDVKNEFSGKEIISLLFPNKIFIPGIIENGLLIKNITSKELTSSSSESIANYLTKLINEEYGINLIDAFSYISQRYLNHFGFSVTPKDVFLNLHEINDIQNKIQEWINLYTDMISRYFKDIEDNKIQVLPEEYLEKIIYSNLYSIQRLVVNEIRNLFKDVQKNSIITMKNANFKINPGELMTNYGLLGQQGKTKSRHSIMGRSLPQQLPKNHSPETYGFITRSLLYGLTPDDYFNQTKDTSLPNIAAITFKTADRGHIGRRVVKFLESLVVNNHKQIETFGEILISSVNHLKISGGDIVKVKILTPDDFDYFWKKDINIHYNKLKRFLIYNNGTSIVDTLDFFILINEEILSFESKEEEEDNDISRIYNFVDYIIKHYFYYSIDDTWIKYCLISYLDPGRLKSYSKKLTNSLFNFIFKKIEHNLNTSISTGTPIGIEIATNLQENFTQQSLSSFHTTDKRGQQMKKLGFDEFKKYVELTKNKYQTITLVSENKNKLESIKTQMEFILINDLNPDVSIMDNNENEFTILLSINIFYLKLKNISFYQYYQMIEKFLQIKLLFENPFISFKIENTKIISTIKVDMFTPYTINVNYFLESLNKDGINKGKLFNNNLEIDTINIYDKNLEKKIAYELKIVIDNINLMSYFDTRDMMIDINDINTVQDLKGIQLTEFDLTEKLLKTFGDTTNSLYNSITLLSKMMCKDKKISSIKKLKEKKKAIIKSAIHGDNNAFSNAGIKSQTDKCDDLYSRVLVGLPNNKGTKYFKTFLDLNKYDQLTTVKKLTEIDIKDVNDLNFFSSL